jgi:hypothetical protein
MRHTTAPAALWFVTMAVMTMPAVAGPFGIEKGEKIRKRDAS